METKPSCRLSRRTFLVSASAATAWLSAIPAMSQESNYPYNGWKEMFEAMVSDGEQIDGDPIVLDLVSSTDSGLAVPYTVSVTPMADAFPRSIAIYCPGNPFPRIATFEFSEVLGVASIKSKMRLGGPQELVLVADMGNGKMAVRRHFIDVLAGGC